MAGGLAAIVLAAFAGATRLIAPSTVVVVAGAAFAALLLESLISRAFELPGWIDNDGVNLVATLVGSALTLAIASFLP